jgi:hypothetical protein
MSCFKTTMKFTAGAMLLLGACGDDPRAMATSASGGTTGDTTATSAPTSTSTTNGNEESTTEDEEKLDIGNGTGGPPVGGCTGDVECTLIDILFVIDNSGTMGEEQLNLAANFPLLIEQITSLTDAEGQALNPDVNIMVTTTDFGHPLCTQFQPEEYAPAQGKPIFSGCNTRLDNFTGIDPFSPQEVPEACTEHCPMDITPGGDPFIHFDSLGSNVTFNDIDGALSCMAPQGISGCGYEAPLEAMLQALRPDACWNDPTVQGCDGHPLWHWVRRGFLRPGSTLAIAFITDEEDCSVASPDGFAYFTQEDKKDYWRVHPDLQSKQPSSAICWGAGVTCTDEDGDGDKEECHSRTNSPVLHPVSRYTDFLDYIEHELGNSIVILGVLGVPPVTAHNEDPPYEPTEGGVHALKYRNWIDGVYDGTPGGGDILPEEWDDDITAAHKTWEFGIGPGCTGQRDDGTFFGQAIPPVRVKEVCESRNFTDTSGKDRIRCCIESICSEDFSPAMKCLADIIRGEVIPEG